MIKEENAREIRRKMALVSIIIVMILFILTVLFAWNVEKNLWDQSINMLMEATQQGCNTLKIQLQQDFESMNTVADMMETLTINEREQLDKMMDTYLWIENGTSLYLDGSDIVLSGAGTDDIVKRALLEAEQDQGILSPHINSTTGVNVFNLYVRFTLLDGTNGFLVKEYEVHNIVDTFSLSFYNGMGFSYVVNAKGDVLIRSSHINSNKTVQNLFDMLVLPQNDSDSLAQFSHSLEEWYKGWAVFEYQGEKTVFCYTPLDLESDWILLVIVPEKVVTRQAHQILMRSIGLIGSIISGISLLVILYIFYIKKVNKKLRSQAEYIGHLYNTIPEAVAILTVNAPYCFIQLNQEGLRLLEYPEDSLNDAPKGRALEDVVHPEDYGKMVQIFQRMSPNDQKTNIENRLMRQDGSFFWVEGIAEKSMDENGNPILICAFRDITEKKLAKEAMEREKLQERLTLVRAISNAYPVMISINLTKDTINFIYIQPGLMLDLGKQKSYHELFYDMLETIHPDNINDFKYRFAAESLYQVLGQQKKEISLEMRQRLLDGKYHWISTQVIYADNPYSEDRLAIILSRRVDEQRYEEEQQRQALQIALENAKSASEAKSQFLSNMSHDIRTPMNAIVGMTAIASSHLDDRERIIECLRKISLSSQHLLSLINDILDMSKIESGKLALREEPINFPELVADTIELIRPQAKKKELKIDVHLTRLKNENVVGDSLRIRQVFINILSNAVKYTSNGGSVQIEIRQEDSIRKGYQRYIFCCMDTGIGMSENFLKRLFQPFERAYDSTTSRIMGTGLGMAITKNLVDLMMGDIQVESELKKGSVFTVALPLRLQDAEYEKFPVKWIGTRSLIVDDDPQIGETALELLEDMGLRPEFVMDGRTAVERVSQENNTSDPFRLVLLDWKMPDMDGMEVSRRIRENVGEDVLVIVLTAYDWAEIEGDAKKNGVTAFLSKPLYRSKICYLFNEMKQENPLSIESLESKPDYSHKRILLVEDNEINREIARELIGSQTGVQIEEACDGSQAVKMVWESEEGYYDLILMDIQMPIMDGYEATRQIRAMERMDVSVMPIVAMTANAFEEDMRAAIRAGMDAHFAKPIQMDALNKMLAQYLSETYRKDG